MMYLTLLNDSAASQRAKITLDSALLRSSPRRISVMNRLTGKSIRKIDAKSGASFTVDLKGGDALALTLSR
jgi:hypothetical protein